ncbi:MAG: hypothetical protein N2C14_06500, partial [Planctomycetales bacterium]
MRRCNRFLLFAILLAAIIAPLARAEERARRQWILVTTPKLRRSAKPLMDRRQQQKWEVATVDASQHQPRNAATGERLRDALIQKTADFPGTTCVLLLGA